MNLSLQSESVGTSADVVKCVPLCAPLKAKNDDILLSLMTSQTVSTVPTLAEWFEAASLEQIASYVATTEDVNNIDLTSRMYAIKAGKQPPIQLVSTCMERPEWHKRYAEEKKRTAIIRRRAAQQELIKARKQYDNLNSNKPRYFGMLQENENNTVHQPDFVLELRNKFSVLRSSVSTSRHGPIFHFNFKRKPGWRSTRIGQRIRRQEEKQERIARALKIVRVWGHSPTLEGSHQQPTPSDDGGDNVVIQGTTEESVATPTPGKSIIKNLCQSTTNEDFASVAKRPCVGTPFEWKQSQSRGSILQEYQLPRDFVVQFAQQEQMAGFRYSQYWRGDMIIKFTLAASPMVTGMCQIALFYSLHTDLNEQWRRHPVSYSMTNHVLLNASTSNDCKLRIPYKNFRSFLQTTKSGGADYQDDPLVVCTVIVSVLNPLGIPPNCTPRVMITPHFWCEESVFMGMKAADYGTPVAGQMPLIQLGQMIYRMYQVYQDYNRDKEIMPGNPAPMVLRHGNLAAGTGCNEALHPMRLHAGSQTPHPELSVDQMTVDYVKQVFGYVATFKWKSAHNVGDIVFAKPATPMWPWDQYMSRVKDSQDIYYIPPVAFIAGLYREWRGALEFRGDIVASKYHVGKLLVSYLPGNWDMDTNPKPTALQLRAGLAFEVALSDGNAQFCIEIPFMYDTPYAPSPQQGKYDNVLLPGYVFVSVLTPLSTTCVVAPDVDINLYVRGGKDFEVAIPRTPAFGLSWNVALNKSDLPHEAKAKEGYYPMYAGVWHDFSTSTKSIMRWGTLTDRIAQFDGCEYGYYYKIHTADATIIGDLGVKVASVHYKYSILWFVPFNSLDNYGLIYMGMCATEDEAKAYWATKDAAGNWRPRGEKQADGTWKWDWDVSQCLAAGEGEWTPDSYKVRLTGTAIPNYPKKVYVPMLQHSDQWELLDAGHKNNAVTIVGHINDERETAVTLTQLQTIGPVRGSLLQFGEDFHDFKDVLRRYIYLNQYDIPKSSKSDDRLVLAMPVTPSYINLDVDTTTDNYFRDGLYMVIASQYRFYRGGMRYKFLFSIAMYDQVTVTLVHRPDLIVAGVITKTSDLEAFAPYVKTQTKGYAQTFTVTQYNPVIEVEIPYYLRCERGLAQITRSSYQTWLANHLGTIQLFANAPKMNSGFSVQIYYSGADDLRFDEYQGHPAVFPIASTGAFGEQV